MGSLRCIPVSLCSWNYRVEGGELRATVDVNTFGEQGRIVVGGREYAVDKGGMMSGRWTLLEDGAALYTAQKVSALYRAMAIDGPTSAMLAAPSMMSRRMELDAGEDVATIEPVHPFTWRAVVAGSWPDDRLVVFAFWLAVLMWRRAASTN